MRRRTDRLPNDGAKRHEEVRPKARAAPPRSADTPNSGGRVTAMAIRSWLDAMPAAALAAEATGKKAASGALKDLKSILQGEAGTTISTASSGILWSQ